MALIRALFLFLALVALMLALGMTQLYLLELVNPSENVYLHGMGIITWITPFIAYGTIFYFSEFQLDLKVLPAKLKSLNSEVLLYILAIAIGLEFLDRPLFDFKRIWDFIDVGNAEPYYMPEADRFIIYTGVFAMILAPVFEELYFRKFLFSKLLERYSATTSISVSSLCFALFHLPSFRNLLPTFIFGVVACLLYKKTGNILYTIFLHVLVNTLWFTLQYWGGDFYNWIFELQFSVNYWMLFLFGVVLTYYAVHRIIRVDEKQL
ncbi:CPBP family intramembrane glutamic endopeptidase [Salinimicrobium oceani]|uniref:CPBP family intramembrane metalloprotease n=1 Tax=Salinimicrobium oceani TaxID=2722702 RepID=A0ABX1D660_9FLAO|nr:CPBP family intramembrane glutamic endopeptidase [Salinimicrobium oceani]NJW54056.1 CPBP family intramembrane metalloprotease [Salinimicrobium oceani]